MLTWYHGRERTECRLSRVKSVLLQYGQAIASFLAQHSVHPYFDKTKKISQEDRQVRARIPDYGRVA